LGILESPKGKEAGNGREAKHQCRLPPRVVGRCLGELLYGLILQTIGIAIYVPCERSNRAGK
jgi:hypothetical protein